MTSYSHNTTLNLEQVGKALENIGKAIQSDDIMLKLNMMTIADSIIHGYDSRTRTSKFSFGDYQLQYTDQVLEGTGVWVDPLETFFESDFVDIDDLDE